MTIITFEKEKLEKRIGKLDQKTQEKITMFGTPIDNMTDTEISIEVFPNRPDLLSFEGFVRGFLAFIDKKSGLKEYNVEKPEKNYQVIIDKSVKMVRPYTVCAIVKNLQCTEDKIKEIIDLQEKLHGSYGRNRKKLAIGIYPLDKISLPIYFTAKKPEDIKFQPLDFPKELNGRNILMKHPTGKEYRHLLENYETFPIFHDENGEILSMPPIINSDKIGKINTNTKEVFVECSGFDRDYLVKTLNIIVCALSDMDGKIFSMEILDKSENKKYILPELSPESLEFSNDFLNKNLGLNLSEKEIKTLLGKMGIGYLKNKNSTALIPPYRTDIIHEIDLIEEIAIAYGYENFEPEIPAIATIGEENKTAIIKRKLSELLLGLNLLEVSSFHLSTKDKQFKSMGVKSFKDKIIEIQNSKTEYNILRTSLLANSVAILSENSDSAYPQRLFELGKVFSLDPKKEIGIEEKEKLCITLCGEKSNFTEIKQITDYIMRMFQISYSIEETTEDSFIEGRCGKIIVNNKEVGIIGEIAPFVIKNNKIKMPIATLEIDISLFT